MTRAGSICDVPVSGIDFYPTLLELAGISVPDEQVIDGMSIVPLLKGQDDQEISGRDLYWHYPHYANQGGDPSAIIRSGPWKLIHYYEDGHDELYNLDSDPSEQTDISGDHPENTEELRARLDAWLKETGAKLPVPDPEHDAEKEQAHMYSLEHEKMPELEQQHADYLKPDWKPNDDWWGSQVTVD